MTKARNFIQIGARVSPELRDEINLATERLGISKLAFFRLALNHAIEHVKVEGKKHVAVAKTRKRA